MKKFMITSILLAMFAMGTTLLAQNQQQESLGLPGDNLNLYAVMKLFQESATLEGFERSINDPNSKINNLDLNGDNLVDYVRVIDNIDGDVHNIVLQVPINSRENQDIAVFTVQRDANGKVYIQLTGDEALYGRNYIIEPILDDAGAGQTPNPGYLGNNQIIDGQNVQVYSTNAYEIASWPLIRFIYLPGYYPWHSSWYYGYYPSYWHPWRPFYWDFYYGYHYNWYNDYYAHYRLCDYHRYNRWNDYYWSGRRSYSQHVSTRIQGGYYRNTYSHPDQRRAGETAFFRSHPDQERRSVSGSSVNSTNRRSDNRPISDRQSIDNGTNRRSANTVTNRPVTNPQSRQNEGSTRQSPNTVTSRSNSGTPSERNLSPNRQSSVTETNRSASNPQSRQNDVSTRRSANTMSGRYGSNTQSAPNIGSGSRSANNMTTRSNSNPQSERGTVANRSSRQSSSSGENASSRSSSSSNRSSGNSSNSGRSKSSGSSKESRRK